MLHDDHTVGDRNAAACSTAPERRRLPSYLPMPLTIAAEFFEPMQRGPW
jgi:hypothetical protein